MAGFYLTVNEEQQINDEIKYLKERKNEVGKTLSPQMSALVGEMSRRFPSADPGVILSTAQAVGAGRMSEDQLTLFIEDLEKKEWEKEIADQKAAKERDKSWWQRNVADKFRTGTRWALAAVQFPVQAVVNATSQAAQLPGNVVEQGVEIGRATANRPGVGGQLQVGRTVAAIAPPTVDGFVISTDLGTLLENGNIAGSGYFIGGEAKELQGERARRYRGTVAGKAWTPGRGLANVFFQPGSLEYNILSGLVDASVEIAVPSVPGGGAIKKGAKIVANRAGLRTLSGLTNYNTAMIIPEKAAEFLGSKSGQKVIKKLVDVNTVDEALEIFPTANVQFLSNVAEISDEVAMKDFLSDTLGLGDVKRGLAPRSIDDINISKWDDVKRNLVQGESKVARMMAAMPGRHVILSGATASDREKMQSLRNVKNYLQSLGPRSGMTVEKRQELVGKLADAYVKDDGSGFLVQQSLKQLISESFDALGLDSRLKKSLLSGFDDYTNAVQRRLYSDLDNANKSADYDGIYDATLIDGKVVSTFQPLNTATLQTEMLKHVLMLPDAQQTRRLVSRIGWMTGKSGVFDATKRGELRIPLVVLEHMQNVIWKPLTLMTAGYVQRNMADSLARQTFNPNVKSGIYHPLELIQIASFKKYKGDILGQSFKGDYKELIDNDQRELAEATLGTMREAADQYGTYAKGQLTRHWTSVSVDDGADNFMQGVASELNLLANDSIARRVAAGETLEDVLDVDGNVITKGIISQLADEPDQKTLRQLNSMWRNKRLRDSQTGEEVTGSIEFVDANGVVNRTNLEQYIRKLIVPRIEATTGGSPIFKEIVASGGYTDETGEFISVFKQTGDAFREYEEDALFRIIGQEMNNPNVTLKEWYKKQDVIDTLAKTGNKNLNSAKEAWDRVVTKFFAELYPKREAWLNRSPVFRQFYYNVIGELLDELDPNESRRLLTILEDRVAPKGKKFADEKSARAAVAKYTGSPELTNRLYDIRRGSFAPPGKLTIEELDAYAKGYALDETQKLFYNVAEKSQFADIMRIIAPFGSAWAEVTKKWAKTLATDPEALKRLGSSVQALQEADPDNDGKGFFFKDPNTGEMMFNYPFSEQLGPMIMGFSWGVTGAILGGIPGAVGAGLAGAGVGFGTQQLLGDVNPYMTAPAKSLNMGLSLFPGLGPFVQVPAAAILRAFPDLDWVSKIAVPYGTPEVNIVTKPSWVDKMFQAIRADPNQDRVFADMQIDAARALSAQNPDKYNLSTPEGIDLLEKDATQTARILLVYRAIGQFAGPSRPSVEFKVDTRDGDVYAGELAKQFFELQARNYDTAVEKFLDMHGDDFILYTAGKTRAMEGGLDATEEFGQWERRNGGLFKSYPKIAGYFAPVGSTFDYQVYLRQLESGKRERLSLRELVAESQFRVGSALYRQVRREAGQSPNKEQRDILFRFKQDLYEKYPGYRDAVLDVNARQSRINQLIDAADDRRLDNNPVAEALRVYLDARSQAVGVAQGRGSRSLDGDKNEDLRGILFRLGEDLSSQFPEFDRLWDRVLLSEVDLELEL